MSQPPNEPPDEPWQPPGPPPPPPSSPAPNPYGAPPIEPYRPIDSGGMPFAAKVVLGVVIGLFAGFGLWVVAAIVVLATGVGDDSFLVLTAVLPLALPALLLLRPATRPWAVGLLIGTAISSIGLASICSSAMSVG